MRLSRCPSLHYEQREISLSSSCAREHVFLSDMCFLLDRRLDGYAREASIIFALWHPFPCLGSLYSGRALRAAPGDLLRPHDPLGIFVALDFAAYSLLGQFFAWAFVIALPSLVLLPVWFVLAGRSIVRGHAEEG